jgi:hypothetical protein
MSGKNCLKAEKQAGFFHNEWWNVQIYTSLNLVCDYLSIPLQAL